jgi:hypothetical protein
MEYTEYEFDKFKKLNKMKESQNFKIKETHNIIGNLMEKLM